MDNSLLGIDVSHLNLGSPVHEAAAAGYGFCYIKASQGATFVDPMMTVHAVGCIKTNLIFGFYHYADPNVDTCSQMSRFKELIGAFPAAELYPALDIEGDGWSVSSLEEFMQSASDAFQDEFRVYASPGWFQGIFGETMIKGQKPWVALYGPDAPTQLGGASPAIWQFSEGNGSNVGLAGADKSKWIRNGKIR